MDFKRRQPSKRALSSGLVGDGLVRLRSASIALMAVVAAIGLMLVALISQMGWPTVLSGPIPAGPELGVVRNDPIVGSVAPQPPVRSAPGAQGGDRHAAASPHPGPPVDGPGSGLGPARQAQPDPTGSAPPPPTEQPAVPTEPAAVVVTAPSHDAEQPPAKQRAAEEEPSKSRSAKSDGRRAKPASRRGRKPKAAAVPPPGKEESVPSEDHSGEVGAEADKGAPDPGSKGGERGKRGREGH